MEIQVKQNEVKWLVSGQVSDLYSEKMPDSQDMALYRRVVFSEDTRVVIMPAEEECSECPMDKYCREMERRPEFLAVSNLTVGETYTMRELKSLYKGALEKQGGGVFQMRRI